MGKFLKLLKVTSYTVTLALISGVTNAKNVALIIGIDHYSDKMTEDLHGAVNDAQSMHAVLTEYWNFYPNDITMLVDEQATQANIINALNELKDKSSAGDEVVIFLSGHGTSIHDPEFGNVFKNALSGSSGAFVPTDYDSKIAQELFKQGKYDKVLKNHLITGQYHIKPVLLDLEKDRHITAIIDACYSQNSARINKGGYAVKTPGFILSNINNSDNIILNTTEEMIEEPYPYRNVVTISASGKIEKASEIQKKDITKNPSLTYDGKPHGLFTDALIRILTGEIDASGSDGILSYIEINEALQKQVQTYPKNEQTTHIQPWISDTQSNEALKRPLFNQHRKLARLTDSNLDDMDNLDDIENLDDIDINVSYIKPLRINIVNGKQEILDNIDSTIFEVVDSGLFDFKIDKSANGWILSTGSGDKITSTSDIRVIRKRINAEYWLKKLRESVEDKANLQFSIIPELAGNTFYAQDKIKIATRIDKPSVLLIFNISNDGSIQLLYPNTMKENFIHQANSLTTIPEDDFIKVLPPYGFEKMVAVSLSSPITKQELKQVTRLSTENGYDIYSNPVVKLADIIQNYGTDIYELNVNTYAKK